MHGFEPFLSTSALPGAATAGSPLDLEAKLSTAYQERPVGGLPGPRVRGIFGRGFEGSTGRATAWGSAGGTLRLAPQSGGGEGRGAQERQTDHGGPEVRALSGLQGL